ncbi:hypothetical protein [Bradyrhizobium sp. HKCCYLR1023]|uniref:hypothetical protein n=1 Tax=Bradyrhizobium TaxID=374 RepID=UPI003EB7A244
MGRVFDEADYRRRLDQAAEMSTGEEAKLILRGLAGGVWNAELEARKTMDRAKQEALRKARKEMIRAIRAEDDRQRQNAFLPREVEEIVTGSPGDELVKVP